MIPKRKDFLINISLGFISLGILYLLIEFLIFPQILRVLPLKYHGFLSSPARSISSSARNGTVPEDYIAIVGDSYAQGMGNWIMNTSHLRNSQYGSHHVLHNLTGEDVITFGQAGAGSIRALNNIIERTTYLNSTFQYRIGDPKTILFYFYEGNDCYDNRSALRICENAGYGFTPRERKKCKALLSKKVQEWIKPLSPDRDFRSWHASLVFYDFMVNIIHYWKSIWNEKREGGRPISLNGKKKRNNRRSKQGVSQKTFPRAPNRKVNKVFGAGRIGFITQGQSQAPPVRFTEEETRRSLYLLEIALDHLRNIFHNSNIIVIYIPSPLMSYEIASAKLLISRYRKANLKLKGPVDREGIIQRSNFVANIVKEIAESQNLTFLDTREAIQKAGKVRFLHGDGSGKASSFDCHFNEAGYHALARAILPLLERIETTR